ncbi:hypothetical protein SLH49_11565 [Cognatiyoonia sp. IB215446]|uniref:hypothetical protein n=1 Tax=Cognatiyoonia sp. IB215446 TaxID=3097355 RepID=UPI002A11DD3F|nr:hypothetical protein [Cognatiyoonia sp. IB215446]MDX8348622.1 hypothetical protein [Cognatiyoonia sp. IB215446]
MLKRFIVYASLASAGLVQVANAQTIQGSYVGCVSEAALDEFIDAAVANDTSQIQVLTGSVCISIEGLQFSVVDRGWSKSQVRVYGNGQSALLWTVSEAIR